jgi:DNA repair protein RecO (recombination protein O)
MLEKTRGIVFRMYKFSETSLIAKVFTEKHGLLSFLVSGIRTSKNKRGNILHPGQLLELDYNFRENKNFQRFSEYKVGYIAIKTATDIQRSCVLTFMVELGIQLVKEGEVNSELFDAFYDTIVEIDQHPIKGIFPIQKLMELSMIMGFHPSNNYSGERQIFNLTDGAFQQTYYPQKDYMSATHSSMMKRLLENETQFDGHERAVLMAALLLYFQLHVPGFKPLKSQSVLHEVLSE